MLQQLLQHRAFGKRRLAGEHEEQRAAERVDVAADVGVARIAGLLGRDVVERAERDAAGRQLVLGRVGLLEARQAHVDQLRRPFGRDQDVRRLDVAVHDVALPGVRQRVGDLQRVAERVGQRQRAVRVHQIADVRAFDVFEDDVVQAAVFADVVDAGDVRMIEPGGTAGFGLEAAMRLGVARRAASASTFTATVRSSRVSTPRNTAPIPPPPTNSSSRMWPSCSPFSDPRELTRRLALDELELAQAAARSR